MPLDGFQTIDLALDLSAAPGRLNGRQDCFVISPKAIRKTNQRSDSGSRGIANPLVHAVAIAGLQSLAEVTGKRMQPRKRGVSGGQAAKQILLQIRSQFAALADDDGGFLWRDAPGSPDQRAGSAPV
jgi:hypothetical protein